jgi:hypothetical protein
MSNRIDLTQFESEEEWDLTGFDWLAKQADSDYVANAVRQVPDLIAELKKRYEEIDNLHMILDNWGLALCPRSSEWFEWDYGCQSEKCASFDDDCRELVEASE